MTDYKDLTSASSIPPAQAEGPATRVRFCPSPTGTPHVGMVRTCLFNWAYARSQGGTFVFRIEDTDAARDSEESFNQIIDSLTWLGLDWDEGVNKGGPHEPYRQSQRMDIYKDVAQKLLDAGYAYESFSTPEEIEARHRAAGRDPKLGYDGFDRDLDPQQRAAYLAAGRKPVLRLRMPDEDITFTDLVRGEITFKAGSVPDYVIVRANGDPLYTLVNPVDDALMEITHVLRGEDLLSSTPRQIVLYRALYALGIAKYMPFFGHLPYVMGEGNKKLSKRDPESNLLLHRRHGIIPEGLVNYLALLGWSIAPDRDIFSMSEMAQAFDIRAVNPNPARFDQKKCNAINAEHIRLLEVGDFTRRLVPFLFEGGAVAVSSYDQLSAQERRLLDEAGVLAQTRVQQLDQITDLIGFLFRPEVTYQEKALVKLKDNAAEVLRLATETVAGLDAEAMADTEAIHEALGTALVETAGIKPREAFAPLFVAMSGSNVSIPVFDSMRILGQEETLRRLAKLLEQLS